MNNTPSAPTPLPANNYEDLIISKSNATCALLFLYYLLITLNTKYKYK